MDFSRKNILITGATGGIGSALAIELKNAGARLVIQGRSLAKLMDLNARLGSSCIGTLTGDLSKEEDRISIANESISLNVNCLINNAGINSFSCFEQSDIDKTMNLNVIGTMSLTQSLIAHFKSLDQASIVNIGSTFGTIGFPGYVTYCASKHAIKGFSDALKRELADTHVKVIYVSPRATSTRMNSESAEALNEKLGVSMDSPGAVARAIVRSMGQDRSRHQLGWPERLQSKLNGILPGIVDSALARQLPIIKRFMAA